MAKQEENNNIEQPEVAQEFSEVASSPKQGAMLLVVIGIAFLGLCYFLFFTGGDDNDKPDLVAPSVVEKPVQFDNGSDIPPIPTLPEPPKIEQPSLPELPSEPINLPTPSVPPDLPPELPNQDEVPPLPVPTQPGIVAPTQPALPQVEIKSESAKQRENAKRISNIMLIQGTKAKTVAEQSIEKNFSKIGSMQYTIRRGKLIEAVLETAINSSFVGEIRAVVSRDVYSEAGRNVLIPRGSRIIGSMKEESKDGFKTVFLTWEKIYLPTGYAINFQGINVDNLGRHFTEARVDMKYRETITNAIMVSAFNIAVARGLDKVVEPQATSEAAANRTAEATSLRNAANTIFVDSTLTSATKIANICATVPNSITDKSSSAFTTIQEACTTINQNIGSTPAENLASLMTTINNAADTLLAVTNTSVEETQEQNASKEAYDRLTDTLSTIVGGADLTPVVSVDQGTKIKVYVNQDYVFPTDAVTKRRVMR